LSRIEIKRSNHAFADNGCTLVHTELFRFENAPLITLRAEQDECPASGMFWASARCAIATGQWWKTS